MTEQNYQPHERRVIEEKAELDAKLLKLREFTATEKFASLDMAEQRLLQGQAVAMDGYSSILRRRIERFTPAAGGVTSGPVRGFGISASAPVDASFVADRAALIMNDGRVAYSTHDDFPLGKACDLSGDTGCEACQ